jgi:TRAP-type C4-dicarboxylate transport system permease small subunit
MGGINRMDAKTISNKLGVFSSLLAYLGALALFLMMALTTADVVGRYLFNAPILGVFEITEFMVLILIFSFIGYAQSAKSHVSVELLAARLPERIQVYVNLFNHAVCLLLMALITWMGVERALELKEAGEASTNLGIPRYPFVFFLVLGCAVLSVEYIRDLIGLLRNKREATKP